MAEIPAIFDRSEIMRGLSILYPSGHGIIELVAIKKDGYLLSSRFNDREKMVDEIAKYDRREDTAAIYTTLNRLDEGTFQRDDHVLTVDSTLAPGPRVNSGNVARVTGILFDIDPFRANGDKKDSTTESEHQAAIEAADFLKRLFAFMGWPEPVVGSSGNGAALRYACDLPASEETKDLLSRMLKAANGMLPERLATQIEVDPAVFDLSRISKVFGTMTRKGPGTTERPHRRAAIISAPEKLEPVKIDCLIKLAAAGKRQGKEDAPREPHQSRVGTNGKAEPFSSDAAERLQALFTADPGFKSRLFTPVSEGDDRSKAEFHFCARLWEAGFSEDEIYHIMTSSPQTKWAERDETYRQSTIEAGIAKAEASRTKAAGLTAAEVLERIKADPRALKVPAILAALAALKANDPIEYDLLLESIKKAGTGVKVVTINELVDKCVRESEKATEKPQDIPSDIIHAAQVIIDDGKAYEYIYKIWQKRVKGNEYLGKALLVSRGVQSCLNTKGVHVYAHGKHGHGKSEGMEKMVELCPPEYKMDEDVSPLAIHYASMNGMLLPGTTLLIDEMIWSDSLGGIIKRVITRFQKGAGHLTVIDGESVLVRTQPRLAIWTNSADLQADEQLRDRFLDEPITEGKEYVKEIIEFQKLRDTLPESSEGVEKETAICQTILRDLAGKTFTVKIPFATRIEIEASEGTRGYNIFSDLVKGLAAMRYAQRKTNDQGQLLATEADFKDAKDIYEGSKGHSEESYTTAEISVLQAIIKHGYKALYKDIKNITEMSEGRIKDIVNGRGKDEQKRHGLRYKCSQLDVSTVDISTVIKGTYSDRVTIHPIELSLPSSFTVDAGVRQKLVTLNPDVVRRSPDVDPDVVDIDSSSNRDVVDVVNEEREEEDTSKLQTTSVEGSIPSLSQKKQNATSTTSRSSPIAKSTTSTSTTPYVSYVCVKCGEDLTGHGSITKGGKIYCARVGCGYPKRGEEKA